jgi:hypothetical protein
MHDAQFTKLFLQNQDYEDVSFLEKFLDDMECLRELDLSDNKLGNVAAGQIKSILEHYPNLKVLKLKNNDIGSDGLQIICSSLCNEKSQLEYLDIEGNPISDRSLKMIFAMLYQNLSILEIKYTLRDKNNIEKMAKYHEMSDKNAQECRQALLIKHKPEFETWQKIVFPYWFWVSLMHDKHEAFAFKYDTTSLRAVEEKIMRHVGLVLYANAIVYYFIMFFCPLYFVQECGYGLSIMSHTTYLIYAAFNIFIEVIIVFWIQSTIKNE